MVQEWKDYSLGWNESEYGGISSVRIPPSNIWKPDIFMYNRSAAVIWSVFSSKTFSVEDTASDILRVISVMNMDEYYAISHVDVQYSFVPSYPAAYVIGLAYG